MHCVYQRVCTLAEETPTFGEEQGPKCKCRLRGLPSTLGIKMEGPRLQYVLQRKTQHLKSVRCGDAHPPLCYIGLREGGSHTL